MRRREFIISLAGASITLCAPQAQPTSGPKRVGVLTGQAEDEPGTQRNLEALRRELEGLGWRNGDNLQLTYRFAAGDVERTRKFATELVGLAPDLIVGHTTPVAAALHQETRTLPVVFISIPDPVANGFVASIARPGGNMTGFTNYDFAMGAKWLEFLKEIAPQTTRVTVLLGPTMGSYYAGYWQSIDAGARANSVHTNLSAVRDPDQIEGVISTLGREPGGGLIVVPYAPITAHVREIIELTARYRVPAVYPFRYFAAQGGLIAYGTSLEDLFRRAATYVDRILKGEKPADLPVQAPTKFELAINMQTAKALGLNVPQFLLERADEVIE